MACLRPYVLINEQFPQGLDCPCGHCIGCRITRSGEWALRLGHELSYYDKSCFITLTYRPDCCPENYSLKKRELQLFFKRLRINLERSGLSVRFKYFSCGEYGKERGRPHYHVIFFGLGAEHSQFIQDAWNQGRIDVGTATKESIHYVTGYLCKDAIGQSAKRKYQLSKREPPFMLSSLGLGKRYAIKEQDNIRQNLFIPSDGKKRPVPRYYRRVLEISGEVFAEKAIENANKIKEYHMTKNNIAKLKDINYNHYKSMNLKVESGLINVRRVSTDKHIVLPHYRQPTLRERVMQLKQSKRYFNDNVYRADYLRYGINITSSVIEHHQMRELDKDVTYEEFDDLIVYYKSIEESRRALDKNLQACVDLKSSRKL